MNENEPADDIISLSFFEARTPFFSKSAHKKRKRNVFLIDK
jgi:hypothetical protein